MKVLSFVTPLIVMGSLVGCTAVESSTSSMGSDSRSDVLTQQRQQDLTPDEIIAELKAGNDRFVRGDNTPQDWLRQASVTADEGQYPKAIILSCLDSRVPPELIFDRGIGDIFVGRVAGNFENTDMLGSMEFGTKLAGSKVIVVLGHTACGAVKGAIAGAEMGNLTETLENIQPAVADARKSMPDAASDDSAFVQAVVERNVIRTVRDISERSPIMAEMIASGELKVVGAWYDLATGKVTWLDS